MNRSLKRAAIVIFAVCSISFALYAFRSPVLAGLASFWIVDEPLAKADAIVVLGGGLQYRPFEAARLYRDGCAPRVLVTCAKPSPTDELGLTVREKDLAKQVLLKQGVPDTAITEIGENLTSTFDESVALRAWMTANGAKTVIIPTDVFHTRRVRWLFRQQLGPTGAKAVVRAIVPREYTAADWWRHEEGLIAFQNEIIKFARYRVIY